MVDLAQSLLTKTNCKELFSFFVARMCAYVCARIRARRLREQQPQQGFLRTVLPQPCSLTGTTPKNGGSHVSDRFPVIM